MGKHYRDRVIFFKLDDRVLVLAHLVVDVVVHQSIVCIDSESIHLWELLWST